VDGRSQQVVVKRSEIGRRAKDDVSGVLGLCDAPVIATERRKVGNEPGYCGIHALVQLGYGQTVGQLLSFPPVADGDDGVVLQLERNACGREPGSEPVVTLK
jgi:hypothetical protein